MSGMLSIVFLAELQMQGAPGFQDVSEQLFRDGTLSVGLRTPNCQKLLRVSSGRFRVGPSCPSKECCPGQPFVLRRGAVSDGIQLLMESHSQALPSGPKPETSSLSSSTGMPVPGSSPPLPTRVVEPSWSPMPRQVVRCGSC